MTDNEEQLHLAELAYTAYGQTTGFKNYQGLPMPAFTDLGDTIQKAWINATQAVITHLAGPTAED